MNKLPKEHIIPEGQKLGDMKIGDVRWKQGVQTTQDGTVWLQKKAEVFPDSGWDERLQRHKYAFKVERLDGGFKVWLPKGSLPMGAKFSREALETVCFEVTEIEIIDDTKPE